MTKVVGAAVCFGIQIWLPCTFRMPCDRFRKERGTRLKRSEKKLLLAYNLRLLRQANNLEGSPEFDQLHAEEILEFERNRQNSLSFSAWDFG
jgi:hypothetical protein